MKTQIALTWFLRLILTLLVVMAVTAVGETYSVLAWEISILANELGHYWAVLVLMIAAVCFIRSHTRARLIEIFVCIALLAVFLRPTLSSLTSSYFSFSKLFWPEANPASPFRTLVYKETDGAKLTLDFYPPRSESKSATAAPWVLVIHGGGWQSGDSAQLAPLNSYLAHRGYGVVAMNYRHAPAHQWPSQRDDAVSAIQFVKANAKDWNLDSRRYAILGRSAGAQTAGAIAYGIGAEAKMESPKALVSLYGPTDMVFAYDNSKPGDVLEPIRLLEDFLGGKPNEAQANYKSASPMELVKKSSCPTLLLHGTEDPIVRVQHSRRLEARLKKLGVPVSLIELPWATHGFDFFFHGPGGQISTNAIENFLAKTLKHDVKK